jgi:transposase InsO family protein
MKRIRTLMPGIGGKKMFSMIKGGDKENELLGIGRDKFLRILRENGLLNKRISRKRGPGTNSRDTRTVYPNLKKNKDITHINEVIESDITAIRVKEGYKPLAICMDVYSRKILGWELTTNWSASEVVKALREAEKESGHNLQESIHHSDQGSQYGSKVYGEVSKSFGMIGSMSRKGTPTDAAHIERLNRTLKREFNLRRKFTTFDEAKEAVYMAVLIYNEMRPHWSLNLRTPSQVYEAGTKLISEPNPFRATPSMG